jgi:hypothetical protein
MGLLIIPYLWLAAGVVGTIWLTVELKQGFPPAKFEWEDVWLALVAVMFGPITLATIIIIWATKEGKDE